MAAKALEKERGQIEQKIKKADGALSKALAPSGSRRGATKNAGEPWLDFNAKDIEELRRCVDMAYAARRCPVDPYRTPLPYASHSVPLPIALPTLHSKRSPSPAFIQSRVTLRCAATGAWGRRRRRATASTTPTANGCVKG